MDAAWTQHQLVQLGEAQGSVNPLMIVEFHSNGSYKYDIFDLILFVGCDVGLGTS